MLFPEFTRKKRGVYEFNDGQACRSRVSAATRETHRGAALTGDIKPQSSIEVIKSATIADRLNYWRVLSAARRK